MLDPADPVSIGAMVGPEAFIEVRYLAHAKQTLALERIPQIADGVLDARFGRAAGGLVRRYRLDDAETVVVALGSVLGTLEDTVDELRDDGLSDRRARHHLVPALPARRRCARRCEARSASSCWRRASRSGIGGVVSTDVRAGAVAACSCTLHGGRRPRRPADHQGIAARTLLEAVADGCSR